MKALVLSALVLSPRLLVWKTRSCITADSKDERVAQAKPVQVVQQDNTVRLTKEELFFILKTAR